MMTNSLWQEFQEQVNEVGPDSEQLLHVLFTEDNDREVDFLERDRVRLEPSSELIVTQRITESTATVKVRRGQQFFRQAILNAYDVRCCISGISVPRLLVAKPHKTVEGFSERAAKSAKRTLPFQHSRRGF